MSNNFNPYDDDPFDINVGAHQNTTTLTPTINTTTNNNVSTITSSSSNNNNNIFKPRAFTTSPNHQPQFNSNYFQSNINNNNYNNNTPNNTMNTTPTSYHHHHYYSSSGSGSGNNNFTLGSPVMMNNNTTITTTPNSATTTPRRSTIGFEDDFSDTIATTPLDTNFTIESSDFLLSLGASPSHRHTLSGASTNTINNNNMNMNTTSLSPQIMPSNNNLNMNSMNMNNHHFMTSPRSVMNHSNNTNTNNTSNNTLNTMNMSSGNGQNKLWNSTANVTGTNTSPYNTPRQSIANSNEFNSYSNFSGNSNNNNGIENPTVNSIKSGEKQSNTTVKRRSRTMFESNNRNNNLSKDLLDFNPFSTNSNTTTNNNISNNNTNTTITSNTSNNTNNNIISNNNNNTSTTSANVSTNSNEKSQQPIKGAFDLLDLKNSLQEYDELSGESSPVNSRPKSMKFIKSTFDPFNSKNTNRNSVNSNTNTNDSISPNTNSSISNNTFNTTNTNTTNTTLNNNNIHREMLHLGMDNKLTIPENILMICLSDSGIVKSYVSDQIEELCMMGIFCELILHKKITTRPLRDLCKGKFGLQVLDSKPIQISNKRDTSIIELLNEVLNLINGINEKCLAKDVNQMTVKDYIKILCLGRKVGNVLIYKIANILTRIGKQLSERKIVDYKKTLFLFLSLPIKDKIERDRCLNELIVFLKMLRTELDLQEDNLISISGSLTYDTCTERMLKNRHDFVIYTLLGIFTMNNTDILSNDIIKNENDRKALKELSFSIFNINNNNNTNGSKNSSFKNKSITSSKHTTLIDEQMMDMVESDDEQSEDNMLSANSNSNNNNNSVMSVGGVTSSNNLTLDKKTNINLHHFPEGLNYFEEIALQLKRCIYGSNKQ